MCRMVRLGKHSGLPCISYKVGDSFPSVSKLIKRRDVMEFLTHSKEPHNEIHRPILALYGEETVDKGTELPTYNKS